MMEEREGETSKLIAWMRRGSRGRFVDTEGFHGGAQRPQTNHGRFSFFGRSSIIPNLDPSTPPPAYASQPGTPAPAYVVSSPPTPLCSKPSTPVPTVRLFTSPTRSPATSYRPEPASPSPLGRTVSTTSSTTVFNIRPPVATRSVSDSTLHPSLPVPSRAVIPGPQPWFD